MVGYNISELISTSIFNLVLPDDINLVNNNISKNFQDAYYLRLIKKDKNIIFIEARGKNVQINNTSYRLSSIRDITERVKSEEKLQYLFQAMEQLQSIIFITNVEGIIEYVNPFFSVCYDYLPEEVINKSIVANEKWFIQNELFYKELWKTLNIGKSWKGKIPALKKNGDIFWTYSSISPLKDDKENITGYIIVQEDITEKEELKKMIFTSSTLAEEKEKKRIAQELHDGLVPVLSSIKMYYSWLKENKNPENNAYIIDKGEKLSDEAIETVREISSNLNPSLLEKYGLEKALNSYISRLSINEKFNIRINFENSSRLDNVLEINLFRIFSELLNNTIKHSIAHDIIISKKINDNKMIFEYIEDGKGFDFKELIKAGKGNGLMNIVNRITNLRGNYEYFTKEDGFHFIMIFIIK